MERLPNQDQIAAEMQQRVLEERRLAEEAQWRQHQEELLGAIYNPVDANGNEQATEDYLQTIRDWEAYRGQRPTEEDVRNLPTYFNFQDKHANALYDESLKQQQPVDLNAKSISELTALLAKAEHEGDETSFVDIDVALSHKVEELADAIKTSRNPKGLPDEARENIHARVRRLKEMKLAELGGEKIEKPEAKAEKIEPQPKVETEQPKLEDETPSSASDGQTIYAGFGGDPIEPSKPTGNKSPVSHSVTVEPEPKAPSTLKDSPQATEAQGDIVPQDTLADNQTGADIFDEILASDSENMLRDKLAAHIREQANLLREFIAQGGKPEDVSYKAKVMYLNGALDSLAKLQGWSDEYLKHVKAELKHIYNPQTSENNQPPAQAEDNETKEVNEVLRLEVGSAELPLHGEDRMLVDTDHNVYAIIDGMGGHGGGDVAAEIIRSTFAEKLAGMPDGISDLEAIKWMEEAFLMAQQVLDQRAAQGGVDPNMGAAASAIKFFRNKGGQLNIVMGHVGDTRIALKAAGDKDYTYITEDENYVDPQGKTKYSVLDNALAANYPLKLNQFATLPVHPGDRIPLWSDGITGDTGEDGLQHPQEEDMLAAFNAATAQEAANKFIEISRDLKHDDKSVIVVDVPANTPEKVRVERPRATGPSRSPEQQAIYDDYVAARVRFGQAAREGKSTTELQPYLDKVWEAYDRLPSTADDPKPSEQTVARSLTNDLFRAEGVYKSTDKETGEVSGFDAKDVKWLPPTGRPEYAPSKGELKEEARKKKQEEKAAAKKTDENEPKKRLSFGGVVDHFRASIVPAEIRKQLEATDKDTNSPVKRAARVMGAAALARIRR